MKNLLFFLLISLPFLNTSAQRTCASMEVLQQQLLEDPDYQNRLDAIEVHTAAYVAHHEHSQDERAVITIPVVFHVIHNGDAVGSSENISSNYIQAQIAQLNLDYRKLNSDAANIPSVFASVAADVEVEFCLAQRDPSGNATTGINRYNYGQASPTTSYIDNTIKPATIWDRSKYLNIWVTNIGGGILGYATFPGGTASKDGVVVAYYTVGSNSLINPAQGGSFGRGRTATHEVGHWLNLRHIWGDANCGSDLVSDTPTHNTSNYGCPSQPHYSTCSGQPREMTMNYMDYTDDACMYMFSSGQKTRMRAVLTTGGARASLATSNGCVAPSGGTTCTTPTGLATANITSSSATLSWTAVSGATSYTVQYKTNAATTWTSLTATSNSVSLTGLAASTTYNWRVQTTCSSGTSTVATGSNFTTLASGGTTCAAPSGLAVSNITANSATLGWSAVSGATSYSVQYKTSTATTWTTVSASSNSLNLTGLSASTTYNWRVQTICSGGGSSTVNGSNFTTTAASTGTADCNTDEPNESASAATPIGNNVSIDRYICTGGQDWYVFTTTASAPKVRVSLTSLPADYELYLMRGNYYTVSENSGTTDEQITYNATSAGTYYVGVTSYNGAASTTDPYTLTIQTQSASFRYIGTLAPLSPINVSPNPATDKASVSFVSEQEQDVTVQVFDLMGRIVLSEQVTATEGNNQIGLNLNSLVNGYYLVQVDNGISRQQSRLVVVK
ncbi:MAG: fibronectin type III domain-containing protein [Chitinophagales bacterium]|nr:fibronectin type III domain-containing protein [Chitinophagales bacterium]